MNKLLMIIPARFGLTRVKNKNNSKRENFIILN